MIAALIINVALVAVVFTGIVGMLAWAIRSGRPPVVALAPAHSAVVRENVMRAHAAHGDRARAARAQRSPGTVQGLSA
jgi:hypothetical protein